MIFSNEDKLSKVIIANCNCGCDEAIELKKFKDEEEVYLTILASKFSNQKGIIRTIGHRLKIAWLMLIGKEYRLCELVLSKSDLDELKKRLGEI